MGGGGGRERPPKSTYEKIPNVGLHQVDNTVSFVVSYKCQILKLLVCRRSLEEGRCSSSKLSCCCHIWGGFCAIENGPGMTIGEM